MHQSNLSATPRPTHRLAAPMTIIRPRRIRAAGRGSETHFSPLR